MMKENTQIIVVTSALALILSSLYMMSLLTTVITTYITMAALIFLPRLLLNDEHIFLLSPSIQMFSMRLYEIFNFKNHFSIYSRFLLFTRWNMLLFNQPLWHFLWTIDDFIFPNYRNENMNDAVFVMGGFRTGSTSLHRTLALDKERFITPRILEITFPFMILHKFFDFLESLDEKFNTSCIETINKGLQNAVGEDVMKRHPMSFYAAEEDDLIFSAIHGCGYYAGIQFPSESTFLTLGQMSKFSQYEKERCFQLYCRVNQKVMYRRGHGKTLLAKSHLIEMVDILNEKLPDAKFVDIVRHPKDSFGSWIGLQQAGAQVFAKSPFPADQVTEVHFKFWDLYFGKEMEIFNKKNVKQENRNIYNSKFTQLTFKEYVVDPVGVAKMLYNKWNMPYEGTSFQKEVEASVADHKKYKSKHTYRNPTLEEMGTNLQVIEERYSEYIKACKL